ncbi:4Fe-4S dicluster domain-containing protein [Miniphocaeibacter halophilus]|uniref:4Fe-4S dicluster domain-containing protein n=1 Tax=Miniphocaeibacter halophilus TaxID=2931922 RepID=A0AC61N031_9FIRM|nr:4Fe-4S dicluster domain-containing protein [Miniphocaeibacter halophilus]QQK08716.1 4Fe-4S dicluster domain-containing protein [Miniphocaeibacter halophilus]
MKETYFDINNIRLKVFSEIAKMAYSDTPLEELGKAVYRILPGEVANYRDSIFLERAIVSERLRLGLGLKLRQASDLGAITDGIESVDVDHRIFEEPLINVIPFACESCPTKTYYVTNNCRRCLAHPCSHVCPKNAITIEKNQAVIDEEKCIKCGKCKEACPYNAIIMYDRPCASVCGVKAIETDYLGRASINQDKCVACGRCITECPFGAISDKSQIYQIIKAIKSGKNVYAEVAPSFIGQFGALASPIQIKEGIKRLGFKDVMEVGLGADFTTMEEALEYIERVPEEIEFMGTSCCHSWYLMVKNEFPELIGQISDSSTPMTYTGRYIKEKDPEALVVFIGPCISKKLEGLTEKVKKHIDFVITFEELMGMFVGKGIELSEIEVDGIIDDASSSGRGYAQAGGVAQAVKDTIHELNPSKNVEIVNAETLEDCIKMLKIAKAGKYKGCLLEGMACPNGCIGGAGTIASPQRVRRELAKFMKESKSKLPLDNMNLDFE